MIDVGGDDRGSRKRRCLSGHAPCTPLEEMRHVSLLLFILSTSVACTGDRVIEGTLLEDGTAERVWIDGSGEPMALLDSGFRFEGVRGDTINLLFDIGEEEPSSMQIVGIPGGAHVSLREIWFAEGLAFPNFVDSEGGRTLTVNGIRMGSTDGVMGELTADGTVLSLSRENGTLLLRPFDPQIPDLRVLLGAGAILETIDGDRMEFGRLSFGDTISVRGQAESGYLLATEIGMPRPIGATNVQEDERDERPEEKEEREEESRGRDAGNGRAREAADADDNQARRGVERGRRRGQGR